MSNFVIMPKAGISVESCIIGTWRKNVGDAVAIGDILFDYETDKAAFECESTAAGTLLQIFYESGDEVPCLENVCEIGEEGGTPTVVVRDAASKAYTTAQSPIMSDTPIPPATPSPLGSVGISPRAKTLAHKLDIDAQATQGTGPNGRIIERDIRNAETSDQKPETKTQDVIQNIPATEQNVTHAPAVKYTDEKFTLIRKRISQGMTKSLAELAQLTHHHSFDATEILSYRKLLKENGTVSGLASVTLNDIVLFAVSRTLKNHTELNAHVLGEGDNLFIRKFAAVNLGIAMDTPRGLIVPTIFNADTKSLSQISSEVKLLGEMAKNGTINPDLLQGATFTVSNLGNTGVEMFTPIVNPPQTAILGVCGLTDKIRPAKSVDSCGCGSFELYKSMGLSITYDHRAVDGAPASRFAADLCRNLEMFGLLLAL
ncbi:MAG: 2-oxo acid dehydrogenase subunit E2 [Defluviitaleaceae bacterium]|nr:2-oxo acid dehydrogenase subunit E2 [Defluviitaleaceae bacterium]